MCTYSDKTRERGWLEGGWKRAGGASRKRLHPQQCGIELSGSVTYPGNNRQLTRKLFCDVRGRHSHAGGWHEWTGRTDGVRVITVVLSLRLFYCSSDTETRWKEQHGALCPEPSRISTVFWLNPKNKCRYETFPPYEVDGWDGEPQRFKEWNS